MNIKNIYNQYLNSSGIVTDSRNIKSGSMFFALKGENFNGNTFAKKAIQNGALCAVIDEVEFCENENFILVDNVLKTLQDLANFHRKKLGMKILGITGTNGKTTTKELVNAVLSQKFKTVATIGNLNNHIGVPLTLLSMNQTTEFGIVEMGANHCGEIDELCKIAEPDFGIITNVGTAHIEGFGSFEGVVKTKTELYNFLEIKDGIIFYNKNNEILSSKVKTKNKSYGCEDADLKSNYISANPFLKLNYIDNKQIVEINTNLIGKYNFENVSAAVCVAKYFEIENIKIKNAIENYFPTNNRSQIKETQSNTLILDLYNANPSSMSVAINNFAEMQVQNKILIIGDMFELGNVSETEHKKIVELIKNLNFANVYLVGYQFEKINDCNKFKTFTTSEILYNYLKQNNIMKSTILLKASRGVKLEKVVELL